MSVNHGGHGLKAWHPVLPIPGTPMISNDVGAQTVLIVMIVMTNTSRGSPPLWHTSRLFCARYLARHPMLQRLRI